MSRLARSFPRDVLRSVLFSSQMYSKSSVLDRSTAGSTTVHGFVYAFESSMAISTFIVTEVLRVESASAKPETISFAETSVANFGAGS